VRGFLPRPRRLSEPRGRLPLTPTLSPLRGARGHDLSAGTPSELQVPIRMAISTEYIPGVCNIGADETRYRLRLGLVGTAVTAACAIALWAIGAGAGWFLLLFFPAFGSAISLIQARSRFCVHFGRHGLFNFAPRGTTESVGAEAARRVDRAKAVELIRRAALVAAAATLIVFLLALLA